MGLFERADLAPLAVRRLLDANSSSSMRSGIIAAALITMNGPLARAE